MRKGKQMKKPYTIRRGKEVWRNHLRYDWWRYVGFLAVAILLWSMIATSLNKVPPEEKVDIYLISDFAESTGLESLAQEMLPDFPELREINFLNIPSANGEDYLNQQKLVVNVAAKQGDIYIGSIEEMSSLAEQGLFEPLEENWAANVLSSYIPQEDLTLYLDQAADLSTPHYYAAPADQFTIFQEYYYDTTHKVMGVPYYSINKEKAQRIMVWLLTHSSGE